MRRTANEIDGEVLLRLRIEDVKSEIGITAFGVLDRIMQGIEELRREGELVAFRAEC